MPSAEAEVYFIAAMMVLILLISFVAVYFFVRQYRKEVRGKRDIAQRKAQSGAEAADESGGQETAE